MQPIRSSRAEARVSILFVSYMLYFRDRRDYIECMLHVIESGQ
jgi:hypothetical protein